MAPPPGRHLVVVEAYDGVVEFLSDEREKRLSAEALGLPIDEIAGRVNCDVTILGWDEWFRYADVRGSFLQWMPYPATRPVSGPPLPARDSRSSARVRRAAIPARDPFWSKPLDRGLSPGTHGLLANSDPLLVVSYCLNLALADLHRHNPISAIILPMWGGSGYMPQLARATRMHPSVDVPFAVVVTDTSARRQRANQEGYWTRPGITRRQMEDLSLALADLVLTFGPRGETLACHGRPPGAPPPLRVPRRIDATLLDRIAQQADAGGDRRVLQIFLYEAQQAASGALAALDAVQLLRERQIRLERPFVSAGPDMRFAPMQPRSFVEYWSSRGFVKELMQDSWWTWNREAPSGDYLLPVRVYPALFDHLPAVWSELARGSLVLLSAAAAEGLVPEGTVPAALTIENDPTAEDVAAALERVVRTPLSELEALRVALCRQVAAAHRSGHRAGMLDETARALGRVMGDAPATADLSRAALLLLDRRRSLHAIAEDHPAWPAPVAEQPAPSQAPPPTGRTWLFGRRRRPPPQPPATWPGTLSAVVTCYNIGPLLRETVESIWSSRRMPDEVLLVDDGSWQAETTRVVAELVETAGRRGLPFAVVRQSNRGLAQARNAGLERASGEFISFLDGDDLVEPDFYLLAAQLLHRYPRLGGVACWALCFGAGVPDTFWNAPQPELPLLLVENTVVVPCMMRTSVLREIGGYDALVRYNYEDWEASIRMLARGWPIVTIPAYLHRYRVRSDSLFRSMTVAQHQEMRELVFAKHRETVSRFAVEVAMQLEHERGKALYASKT